MNQPIARKDNEESEMLRSICDELGIPNLVEVLAETPLRRSLLMHTKIALSREKPRMS